MRCTRILIVGLMAVLAGCGSVTFKRGAGPDSMAADERRCRAAAADEAGFAACMREGGWFVAMTGEEGAKASAADRWMEAQKVDQNATDAATAPADGSAPAAVLEESGSGSTAPAAANVAATSRTRPVVKESVPTPVPAAAAEPNFDPLAEVAVASWWKLGGSAATLDNAIAACVSELGVAHRPDAAAKSVTAGMRACLRAGGWFAVGN
jgi:hypothetical protein